MSTYQEDREALAWAFISDDGTWYDADPSAAHYEERMADAKLALDWASAAGYRKPPSREVLSEVLMSIYDHGTLPNALREADAVLALRKEEA